MPGTLCLTKRAIHIRSRRDQKDTLLSCCLLLVGGFSQRFLQLFRQSGLKPDTPHRGQAE